ncbi:MAG: hypothetical protein RL653_2694 [Pseudomonadota bacterium]|jgi:multidrug resistance efflux pump
MRTWTWLAVVVPLVAWGDEAEEQARARQEAQLEQLREELDGLRADEQAREAAAEARRADARERTVAVRDALSALAPLQPDVLMDSGEWDRGLARAQSDVRRASELEPSATLSAAAQALDEAQAASARSDLMASWWWIQQASAWLVQTPR